MDHTSRTLPTVVFRCLQLGASLTLVARAWLYYRWGSPIRSLAWDESFTKPLVEIFGWDWSEWVSSSAVDHALSSSGMVAAGIMLIAALAVWGVNNAKEQVTIVHRFSVIAVFVGGTVLLLHVLLSWKSHFFQVGYLLEMGLQGLFPFVFLAVALGKSWAAIALRLVIAATFIGHGLYALGYYPVPGHFLEMTNNGLGLSTVQTKWFLCTVGVLDILAAVGLFVSNKHWFRWTCYYLIGWGTLTALARLWSHQFGFGMEGLFTQWLPEMLVRTVHFLGPLAYWLWRR